jgi:hypothetical protein
MTYQISASNSAGGPAPYFRVLSAIWGFVCSIAKWAIVAVAVFALVRILTLKSLFNTTSGFLTTDLGLTDYAALPLATLLTILAAALTAPLIAYLIFGRKRMQALAAVLILTLCAGALGLFSENLAPDRVFMCRPDEMQFFTRKGASKVFYAKIGERYEFFNRPGAHPQRGLDLQAITPRVASMILDSFEAGDTPATRRECELQRQAAVRRDAETRRESGKPFGDRLLAWMGVGHPDNVPLAQPAPSNPDDVSRLTVSGQTEKAPSNKPVGDSEQAPKQPAPTPAYSPYLAVTIDRPVTAIAIDGEYADLARELMRNQLVEGEALSFSGRFRADGLFERAFSGEADAVAGLRLPSNVNRVVLAKTQVTRTENQSLHGAVRITYAIEARILDAATGVSMETRQFSAQGVGFSDKTAWAQLRERLANGT